MKNKILLTIVSAFIIHPSAFGQGALTPPGAPAPMMRTLLQIEPRTPISALPYTITNPGSYYLTTNLTGVLGQSGISINASDVTLDLAGFVLQGIRGALDGIAIINFPAYTNIMVGNGSVRDWPGKGVNVNLAPRSVLNNLRVINNGGIGIYSGGGAIVSGCFAEANGGDGMDVAGAATVRDCVATGNHGNGFYLGSGSSIFNSVAVANTGLGIGSDGAGLISGCTANQNGTAGIYIYSSGVVKDCIAAGNATNGILTGYYSCLISGCHVSSTGSGTNGVGIMTAIRCTVENCTVVDSRNDGIQVGGDSTVLNNHASHNGLGIAGAAGIHATGAGSRIDGNHTRDNSGYGIKSDGGAGADTITRNTSGGNGSAQYSPTTGTTFAPVQTPSTATSPWANF